jgi:D-arabinitol dehydrogenase (NADP+)
MWCLPCAIEYLDSGKENVRGLVTHRFKMEDFSKALEAIRTRQCIKAVIMPELLESDVIGR